MSKITNRDTAAASALRATARRAPSDRGTVEHRLARLLDTPFLARVVPHLLPETLHQLIRHRGLDACADLVTSATPAQLTFLLDLDLWRHARPGRDERFDVDRFGEWLEVLVDAGQSVAARTVAALDTNLVVAGLSRYVRVLDPGIFEPTAQSDDEPTDRHEAMREGDSSGDSLQCEVGGYIVRARRADAWDAIVTLLVALDAEHGNYFHSVMQGCRRFSNSRSEIDGLDNLLLAPEQHLHDVTIERERRRSHQGYATPADARAFLEMARQPRHHHLRQGSGGQARSGVSMTGSIKVNPIVTAYFRAADEAVMELLTEAGLHPGPHPTAQSPRGADPGVTAEHPWPSTLLRPAPSEVEGRALLEAADPQVARLTRLRPLMQYARDMDETAYFTRSRELAFLANTLLAGCSVQSRPFTSLEASDAAASVCNLGLEYWPVRWTRVTSPDSFPPESFLIDHDLVTAFEVGWSVLHHDVSLFVTQQLISTLDDLHCVDRDIQRELVALRRTLVTQRDAGTPWHARDAAEVLAMLDMTACVSVLGLLDECPVLPAALTAVLEGRTTTVSPTAFEFISTDAQIGDVRNFMRKLPDVLSR